MKKTILFSTALTAVMASSLLATPMAMAYTPDTSNIDIQGVQAEVQANAYKFVDVNWDAAKDQPANPQYTWATGVADWVKTNFPDYIGDGNRVTAQFESSLSDDGSLKNHQPVDNGAATFYDKLSKAIKAGEVTLTPAKTVTADGENASIPDMGIGGYLVLFTGGTNVYRPSVAVVKPTYDETNHTWKLSDKTDLTVKKSAIPVTKTIDDKAVGVTDIATFSVTSAVPVYPANAVNKTFLLADKMPSSLTLQDGTTVVGVASDGSETALTAGVDYTVVTQDKDGKAVDLGLDFNYDRVKQYDSIKATYTAKVNDAATAGQAIPNQVHTTYANDPYTAGGYNKTPDATVTAWTYGVDLTKVDGTTQAGLPGATFSVQNNAGATLKFEETSEGHYKLTDKATGVTELGTDAQGKLKVDGLDTGTYKLVEVKAPAGGYVKLENPISFSITDANNDGVADENASTDKGYVAMTVQNTKGFQLPVTGAAGITGMAVAGVLLLSVGGVLVAQRKRAQKESLAQSAE